MSLTGLPLVSAEPPIPLQASTGRVAAGGSALLRQQGRARVPALGPTVGSRGEARAKLTRGPCS